MMLPAFSLLYQDCFVYLRPFVVPKNPLDVINVERSLSKIHTLKPSKGS